VHPTDNDDGAAEAELELQAATQAAAQDRDRQIQSEIRALESETLRLERQWRAKAETDEVRWRAGLVDCFLSSAALPRCWLGCAPVNCYSPFLRNLLLGISHELYVTASKCTWPVALMSATCTVLILRANMSVSCTVETSAGSGGKGTRIHGRAPGPPRRQYAQQGIQC
jgi:hypothetical protein